MTFKFSFLKKNCHFCHKYLEQWTTDPLRPTCRCYITIAQEAFRSIPDYISCAAAGWHAKPGIAPPYMYCTTTQLFASVTCKAFGNNFPPAVMQAQVFMWTCRVWQIILLHRNCSWRLVCVHAMYALINTWLMTTRAGGSLDGANGGQHATSCHASAGIYVLTTWGRV